MTTPLEFVDVNVAIAWGEPGMFDPEEIHIDAADLDLTAIYDPDGEAIYRAFFDTDSRTP